MKRKLSTARGNGFRRLRRMIRQNQGWSNGLKPARRPQGLVGYSR